MDVWRVITWSGDLVFWFGMAVVLFLKHRKQKSMKLVFGLIANSVFALALKYVFLVPREAGFGPSFPSFHAQTAFFVSTFASMIYPNLAYVLFPFAGLVAISRVELGLHTATDVITGALLGIAFALAFSKLRMRDVHINEIGRQAVHFLGILAVPLAAIIPQKSVAFLCFLTAMIALFISLSKWKIKAITDLLSREKENRYENAVVFYLVLAACLFILPWTLAAIAIVALTVGDAFTTFYGTHFGATPLPHNKKKTVEGAVAGFVATFLALFFIVGRELALILALVTVLAESLPANDNVTIPITTVIAATLLGVAA